MADIDLFKVYSPAGECLAKYATAEEVNAICEWRESDHSTTLDVEYMCTQAEFDANRAKAFA